MIAIVSYGMGNIQSVRNAFEHLGHEVSVAEAPGELAGADKVVIPGVGSFPKAMERLSRSGFRDALDEMVLVRKKPVLGICLGMQILADSGTEFGDCEGLGWVPGRVERIPRSGPDLRLPQVGWNALQITKACPLFDGMGEDTCCYFLHSYHLRAARPQDVSATVDYGGPITAAVSVDHIFGMQYHPEKSQRVGLKVLDNFARL